MLKGRDGKTRRAKEELQNKEEQRSVAKTRIDR